MYERIRHVALRVDDLRRAEELYCELFEMSVDFREGYRDDEYETLPAGEGWDDLAVAGVDVEMSFVSRGG